MTRSIPILVGLVAVLAPACSGSDSAPGSTADGASNAGASGAATGGAGTAGASGASAGGSSGSEPDAAAGPDDLGKACPMATAPAGCSTGLSCMNAVPLGGYVCTRACTTAADCPSNALCYAPTPADPHVCARVCTHQVVCVALGTATSCSARASTGSTTICAGQ